MSPRALRLFVPSLLLSIVSTLPNSVQPQAVVGDKSPVRFYGKMRSQLAPDLVHIYQRVFQVAARPNVRFDPTIEKGAVISSGEIIDARATTSRNVMFLVEPPNGVPYVAVDSNSNGVIEQPERYRLDKSEHGFVSLIQFPLKHSFFKSFPMLIHYVYGFKHPALKPTDRLLYQSVTALANGDVDINGRKLLFQFPFEPQSEVIATKEGLFGVDVNGDGKIRDEQFSPESSFATNTEAVFKLGDVFISTERIDLVKNEIVVRARNRTEYLRHDVEVGKELPDFAFVDFSGNKRSLNEFKGKYVLLDFWGVWCGDCRVETPFHVEAYKRFKGRGLEILSLNTDDSIETAKDYLAKNNMTWTQATNDSIRSLIEVTYQLQEYPSTLLIGPDSKVLVVDQKQLRGKELLRTLDLVLPK
jgi:peroxiredoxin